MLSGSREAFILLIRQYEVLVLHIVTPLIGINEDREDICQDVFLKVFEKLQNFQFQSKLGTWIGNIAYNTSINFLRKKRNILLSSLTENEFPFSETLLHADLSDPEQVFIKQENVSLLNTAINKLTAFQKTTVLLFYQDELSVEEISKILEIPVNTVKSHLLRAKKSLKQLMTQNEKP